MLKLLEGNHKNNCQLFDRKIIERNDIQNIKNGLPVGRKYNPHEVGRNNVHKKYRL